MHQRKQYVTTQTKQHIPQNKTSHLTSHTGVFCVPGLCGRSSYTPAAAGTYCTSSSTSYAVVLSCVPSYLKPRSPLSTRKRGVVVATSTERPSGAQSMVTPLSALCVCVFWGVLGWAKCMGWMCMGRYVRGMYAWAKGGVHDDIRSHGSVSNTRTHHHTTPQTTPIRIHHLSHTALIPFVYTCRPSSC